MTARSRQRGSFMVMAAMAIALLTMAIMLTIDTLIRAQHMTSRARTQRQILATSDAGLDHAMLHLGSTPHPSTFAINGRLAHSTYRVEGAPDGAGGCRVLVTTDSPAPFSRAVEAVLHFDKASGRWVIAQYVERSR